MVCVYYLSISDSLKYDDVLFFYSILSQYISSVFLLHSFRIDVVIFLPYTCTFRMLVILASTYFPNHGVYFPTVSLLDFREWCSCFVQYRCVDGILSVFRIVILGVCLSYSKHLEWNLVRIFIP